MGDLGFAHVYEPPSPLASTNPGPPPTLLLLHGTGGNEHDLLPLGRMLAPEAGVLSPRGKVLERGMPRFFRRLAEGVFDLADLQRRTEELGDFVVAAAGQYAFDPGRVVAVGFSNGANIASSLLLLRPEVLAAAILFRAMVPLIPDRMPALPHTPVLISNGRHDPIVPSDETDRLAALLKMAGAEVTLAWQPGGHELTSADGAEAKQWLSELSALASRVDPTAWKPQ